MKEDIKIFLILTFMVSQICYAQFPPAKYAIKKEDIENNFTSYKFYGGRFNGNQAELNNELSFSKYDEILQTGYMYIYSYITFSEKGEIIMLKISNDEFVMNLYIKLNKNIDEGEIIQFNNFKFKKGNYFFNMYETNNKCHIDFKEDEEDHKKIILDLINLKKHKICLKKIEKILNKKK